MRVILQRILIMNVLGIMLQLSSTGQTYVFAELTGNPINTTGWNLQGNAYTYSGGSNGSEIVLTNPVITQSGALFYNTPINLGLCRKWIAEFEFRIADGNSADGLAFCYLDVPPSGFVSGGGIGIPATANGLKIAIDTYLNCGTEQVPKLEIRWGSGYNECNGQPTRNNNDGVFNFIRNGNYHKCRVEFDAGLIKVFINNIEYLSASQTFDFTGYFGFTASTGGKIDRHSVKNVRIYTEMPVPEAGNDKKLCSEELTELGVQPQSGLVYRWSPSDFLNNPDIANPSIRAPQNTIIGESLKYYVQTEFADKPGCGSRDSVMVTFLPRPQVNFTNTIGCLPNANVNFVNSTQLNGSAAQGSGWLWKWKFNDFSSSPLNPDTSILLSAGHIFSAENPTVKLSATSPEGCYADTSILINNIYSRPSVSFAVSSPTCTNQDLKLLQNIADAGDGSGAVKVYWDFGDGNQQMADNPAHIYSSSGNYQIKMYAAGSLSGCSSDTSINTVTVTTSPAAKFERLGKNCLDSNQQFTDQSVIGFSGLKSRLWEFSDGSSYSSPIVVKTLLNGGKQVVNLKVTDNNGCFSIASDSIETAFAPKIELAVNAACVFNATSFSAANGSGWASGNFSDLNLLWRFNDPDANINNPNTAIGAAVKHQYVNKGEYNVNLLMAAPNGCFYDTILPVKIDSLTPSNFLVSSITRLCTNEDVVITNLSTGNAVSTAVFLNYPSGTLYDNSKRALSTGEAVRVNYRPLSLNGNQSKFILKMENSFANGCISEKLDSIIFLSMPQLIFDSLPVQCANNPVLDLKPFASETSSLAGNAYFSGNGVFANSLFSPSVAGNFSMSYIFKGDNGCADTLSRSISVNPLPLVDAGPNKIVLPSGTAILEGQSNITPALIKWQPGSYLVNANTLRPATTPLSNMTYTLQITDKNGCIGLDNVNVILLPALVIPNAFSPNGDGINDVWNIQFLDSYPGCTVDIFDRYGRMIFTSQGYNVPWNGSSKNSPVPIGVYYYIINPKNGAPKINGSITLLR